MSTAQKAAKSAAIARIIELNDKIRVTEFQVALLKERLKYLEGK